MAKLTWLGEDGPDGPGPSYTVWNGVTFPKGEPIETQDPYFIRKGKGNQFFHVDDDGSSPVPRPSGRAPKGKTWDSNAGEWVDDTSVSEDVENPR